VVVSEALASRLGQDDGMTVKVVHRDVGRE
jgi:hypothetical protein